MNEGKKSIKSIYSAGLLKSKASQLLRPLAFDFWLISGIALIAIASGLICLGDPSLFPLILFLDIWLLGYHHVVSTYTRLCFDTVSLEKHKFLVFYLPFIVAIPCVLLFYYFGSWLLASIYLYWQWFHYSRQSYGLSRIYARKSKAISDYHEKLNTYSLYGVAFLGIVNRSWQAPEHFLGLELLVIPVSLFFLKFVGAVVSIIFVLWLHSQWKQYTEGVLSKPRLLYLLSHHLIFLVSYILISDINVGWLVVNIWHNAQYILIVWLFNTNRFKDGVVADKKFLSTISQSEKWFSYFLICFVISTVLYLGLKEVTSDYSSSVPAAIIAYSIINFHHYIVDGIIWKVRRKEVRMNLIS